MMNIEDLQEALEEALADILPNGFEIDMDDDGQLIIYTGLTQDEDGDLVEFEDDEEDEEDEDLDDEDEDLDDEEDEEDEDE